jgi:hypothetical protein
MSRIPNFLHNRLEVVAWLSALPASRPLPLGRSMELISVGGWVNLRAIVQLEGLGILKYPMTSSGLDPLLERPPNSVQSLSGCRVAVGHCAELLVYIIWTRNNVSNRQHLLNNEINRYQISLRTREVTNKCYVTAKTVNLRKLYPLNLFPSEILG